MLRHEQPYDITQEAEPELPKPDRSLESCGSILATAEQTHVTLALNAMAQSNLERAMEEICALLGSLSYVIVRAPINAKDCAFPLVSTMDVSGVEFFVSELSTGENEAARHAEETVLPFSWKVPETSAARRLKYDTTERRYDVLFRRSPLEGNLYCIMEAEDASTVPSIGNLMMAQGLVQAVFEHLLQRRAHSEDQTLGITMRERECLRWCAEGKTSEEIGIILALSTHTVNNYLTAVTKKLNAVNRMHAITSAFRRGILTLENRR